MVFQVKRKIGFSEGDKHLVKSTGTPVMGTGAVGRTQTNVSDTVNKVKVNNQNPAHGIRSVTFKRAIGSGVQTRKGVKQLCQVGFP